MMYDVDVDDFVIGNQHGDDARGPTSIGNEKTTTHDIYASTHNASRLLRIHIYFNFIKFQFIDEG